jgi:hypothetical protein
MSIADTIVGCSCPGCGQLVQHVAAQYTPSGWEEFWRFGLKGEDIDRDCTACQRRPEKD